MSDELDAFPYSAAKLIPAHESRVGGAITPRAVVVHTTDMMPNSWEALLRAWQRPAETPSRSACAHYLIGRTPEQGVVQMVSTRRNANHAGGNPHGIWLKPGSANMSSSVHPNAMSIGIELHCAGRLEWLTPDRAVFKEDGKVLGEFRVGAGEVYTDALNRPWHIINDYQRKTLEGLLAVLRPTLAPLNGLVARPNAAYVKDRSKWDTSYAVPVAESLVGHATLDTINRMDPGPQGMVIINAIAARDGWL